MTINAANQSKTINKLGVQLKQKLHTQKFGKVHFKVNDQGKFEVTDAWKAEDGNFPSLEHLVEEAQAIYDAFEDTFEGMVASDNKPAPQLPPRPEKPSLWHPGKRWNHAKAVAKWEEKVEALKASPVDQDKKLGVVSYPGAEFEYAPGQSGPNGGVAVSKMKVSRYERYSTYNHSLEATASSDGDTSKYSTRMTGGWIVGERKLSIDWKAKKGSILATTNAHASLDPNHPEFKLQKRKKPKRKRAWVQAELKNKKNQAERNKSRAQRIAEERKKKDETKPEKSWAQKQVDRVYSHASWEKRERLDWLTGGSYRRATSNIDGMSWRERERLENLLGRSWWIRKTRA